MWHPQERRKRRENSPHLAVHGRGSDGSMDLLPAEISGRTVELGAQSGRDFGYSLGCVALSVVIPTLNEAAALPATLEHARAVMQARGTRFVVADCGSRDDTHEIARSFGADVIHGATSRASALNLGAAYALGRWGGGGGGGGLLFLHADCKVPDGFDRLVLEALAKPGVVGGAFDFNWASHPLSRGVNRELLRMVKVSNRIRFRWTGNFYGDQGIFVGAETFHRLGGFPGVGLMEDVRFCQKLKAAGRVAVVSPGIKTSPRRFLTRGVVRQFVADLMLLGQDACGLTPERAWDRYNRLNRTGDYRTHRRRLGAGAGEAGSARVGS